MIYHQFQPNSFQSRFSGNQGWLTFAIGLMVMTLVLLALPFVIIFAAISFICLSLFGRIFLKRQLAKFRQQPQREYAFQPQKSRKTVNDFFYEPPFPKRTSPRQGQTFEHAPNA